MKRGRLTSLTVAVLALASLAAGQSPDEAFRAANQLARNGDMPAAIDAYREIAARGSASPSLYWNWSQAADTRGATGEALWALLRARELDPGDPAIGRELERLRTNAGLEPAELAPEPLAALARQARRCRLAAAGLLLLALSLAVHALARFGPAWPWLPATAWSLAIAGLLVAAPAGLAGLATPTAVVADADVPLVDAASPTAEPLSTLREGEVVLVLEHSGGHLRIQEASGARGWAEADRVRPLEPTSQD